MPRHPANPAGEARSASDRRRNASIPGPGAFLNAWRHKFPDTPTLEPNESITVQTNFRELDAAKILEMPSHPLEDHATIERRTSLRFSIHQTMIRMNDFSQTVTTAPRFYAQPGLRV